MSRQAFCGGLVAKVPNICEQQTGNFGVLWVNAKHLALRCFHLNGASDELSDTHVTIQICDQVNPSVAFWPRHFNSCLHQFTGEPIPACQLDKLRIWCSFAHFGEPRILPQSATSRSSPFKSIPDALGHSFDIDHDSRHLELSAPSIVIQSEFTYSVISGLSSNLTP